MVNRIISVDDTSTAVPKMPSSVMYMWPTMRATSMPWCVHGGGSCEPMMA